MTNPLEETSLLYKRADGTQGFVHDSLTDHFLGDWFAAEVNRVDDGIGRIFEEFWTYEEDGVMWGLDEGYDWRAFLPDVQNLVINVFPKLEKRAAERLVDFGTDTFKRFAEQYWINQDMRAMLYPTYPDGDESLKSRLYNPFFQDFNLMCYCAHDLEESSGKRRELVAYVSDLLDLFSEVGGPDSVSNISSLMLSLAYIRSIPALEKLWSYTSNEGDILGLCIPGGPFLRYSDVAKSALCIMDSLTLPSDPSDSEFSMIRFAGSRCRVAEHFLSDKIEFIRDGRVKNPYLKFNYYHTLSTEQLRANIVQSLGRADFHDIRPHHDQLKPRGYNPIVKRLAV